MAIPLPRVVETEQFVRLMLGSREIRKHLPKNLQLCEADECSQCPPNSPIDCNFYLWFKCFKHQAPRFVIERDHKRESFDEDTFFRIMESEQRESEQRESEQTKSE